MNTELVKVSAPATLVRMAIIMTYVMAAASTELSHSLNRSSRPTSASTSGCSPGSRRSSSSSGSGHFSSVPSAATGIALSPTATAIVPCSSSRSSHGGTVPFRFAFVRDLFRLGACVRTKGGRQSPNGAFLFIFFEGVVTRVFVM